MSLSNAQITVIGSDVIVSAGSIHTVIALRSHYFNSNLDVEQIGMSVLRVKSPQMALALDIQLTPDDDSDTVHGFLVRLADVYERRTEEYPRFVAAERAVVLQRRSYGHAPGHTDPLGVQPQFPAGTALSGLRQKSDGHLLCCRRVDPRRCIVRNGCGGRRAHCIVGRPIVRPVHYGGGGREPTPSVFYFLSYGFLKRIVRHVPEEVSD